MPHVQILLVPILMLAQYWVQVLCASARKKRYDEVFTSEVRQLSPTFEKRHGDAPFWNPRYYAMVIAMTALLYLVAGSEDLDPSLLEWSIGLFAGLQAVNLGRALSNLMTFRYMARNPECVTGQVQISRHYLLRVSLDQFAVLLLPLLLLCGLSRDMYIVGATSAVAIMTGIHLFWIMRAGPLPAASAPGEHALQDPE